jgi:hypothetical protein
MSFLHRISKFGKCLFFTSLIFLISPIASRWRFSTTLESVSPCYHTLTHHPLCSCTMSQHGRFDSSFLQYPNFQNFHTYPGFGSLPCAFQSVCCPCRHYISLSIVRNLSSPWQVTVTWFLIYASYKCYSLYPYNNTQLQKTIGDRHASSKPFRVQSSKHDI